MNEQIRFRFARETKNTFMFEEVEEKVGGELQTVDRQFAKVGNTYVQKRVFGSQKPEEIFMTISW